MLSVDDFSLEHGYWTATVVLPSWSGFQSRGGPYGSLDSTEPSSGLVKIGFAPEGRDESPLRDEEIALVRWVVDHERTMRDAVLAGLLDQYQALLLDDSGEMPAVRGVEDFRTILGLHAIHVHQIEKHGRPYCGFEFGCNWDDEHGLGILMHGTRVVRVGGADTAILLWMASRDAKQSDSGAGSERTQ